MTAFERAWALVKGDPYYCEICGEETDDFVDLDGDMIICLDCFDPTEHEESTLVDLGGKVLHTPYDFSDDEKDKLRGDYQ